MFNRNVGEEDGQLFDGKINKKSFKNLWKNRQCDYFKEVNNNETMALSPIL